MVKKLYKRKSWEEKRQEIEDLTNKMKSKIANLLIDRSHDYEKIDGFIRGAVHHKKVGVSFLKSKKRKG